ncbi:hypothetical protein ACLOJK_002470 [Asimina triloba]
MIGPKPAFGMKPPLKSLFILAGPSPGLIPPTTPVVGVAVPVVGLREVEGVVVPGLVVVLVVGVVDPAALEKERSWVIITSIQVQGKSSICSGTNAMTTTYVQTCAMPAHGKGIWHNLAQLSFGPIQDVPL